MHFAFKREPTLYLSLLLRMQVMLFMALEDL